jgi:osmotically inducible protein OsmC
MAFSHTLTEAGHPPETLTVSAEVSFVPIPEGEFRMGASSLAVNGKVPGIDQCQFEDYAAQGEAGCPISNALRGNVEISVKATLE